jgi:hypothetical protein
VGLAAGTVLFADGSRHATMRWGYRHFLPFEGSGLQTAISGMNDAGVASGRPAPLTRRFTRPGRCTT